MIAKTYGLSPAEYDRLLALQGGRCAICRGRPKSKRLAVDHDHGSGAVRGLLCSRCNHDLLGSAWDSLALASALWHYLNTPPAAGDWLPPERRAAPTLGDERPAPRPSSADGFVVASAGRTRPRSGQGGDALAAALERAHEPREPYAPVAEALAALEAALKGGTREELAAAVEGVRARGLLVPTAF